MFDTLNNALFLIDSNGDKWFKGKVKTNVDPLNLDRIQATVPGLFDPDLGDIPWIGPCKLSPFGFGSGYGVFGTPAVGSDVAVCLQGGDPHYPMYMHIQCFANPGEFPSGTTWGFKDPAGNKLVVTGKEWHFTTGGGYDLDVDPSGNFTLSTPDDTNGFFHIPHVVFNTTDLTINATSNVHIVSPQTTIDGAVTINGDTNINGVTISQSGGNVFMPGSLVVTGGAIFDTMVAMTAGLTVTGAILVNGKNIGDTHKHTGGTLSGGLTGIPI